MPRLIVFIASFGFVGYIPIASGTFGTAAAVPVYAVFDAVFGGWPAATVVALIAAIVFACWVAGRADDILGEHDSHKIVIDEVVGYLLATAFLPFGWKAALVAFFVFRVFDVLKPFPAGRIDAKLPGGPGVVLDDVASGIYANLVTRVILHFLA